MIPRIEKMRVLAAQIIFLFFILGILAIPVIFFTHTTFFHAFAMTF